VAAHPVDKHKYSPCCLLPIDFDAEKILAAVRALPPSLWDVDVSHKAQDDTSRIFLKGYPVRMAKGYDERPALKYSLFLANFIHNEIPGVVRSCLVANLKPGGIIPVHRDYVDTHPHYSATYRLHIPLQTNPDVDFFMGDHVFHLQTGKCYLFDNSVVHAVHNRNATEERIHMIADVEPDDRMQLLLEKAVPIKLNETISSMK